MQFPPAATELPHVLVSEKSPGFAPPIEILVMLNAVLAEFVSVTLCGELIVCKDWLGKVSDVGEKLTVEAPTPVPERAVGIGDTADARVTFSEPFRLPVADGVNATVIAQDPPAATLVQLFV